MRIAVCVSGYPRTWRHCVQSQLDFFGPDTDYFLHTWSDGDDVLAPRDWDFDELNRAYRPRGIFTEKRPNYSDFERKVTSQFDPQGSSANLIYIAHGIYEADRLRRAHERRNVFIYDYVFRIRYDLLFRGRVNLGKIAPGKVTVPYQGNYHGGVNDQLACGSSSVMQKFAQLLLSIDKTLSYPPNVRHGRYRYIGEVVLKYYLETQGLQVHHAPIEYRVLRPHHVGVPFDEIPVNDPVSMQLRNDKRLSRAAEIL